MKKIISKPVKVLKRNVRPEEIAISYLKHEFRKIFSDVSDKMFFKKLDKSLERMPKRFGSKFNEGFWMLLAAIAEGWKLKWVFRLLSDNGFKWQKEIRKLEDITLTGMSPALNPIIYNYCKRKPSKFKEWWQTHKKERKNNPAFYGMRAYPERDHFPVLLHKEEKLIKVFDGMRRILMAAVYNKETILCYTGYKIRKSRPRINSDKLLFLKLLTDKIKKDNNKFFEAMKIILKETSNQYVEVKDLLLNWYAKDPSQFTNRQSLFTKLIKEMIKENLL